MSYGHICVEALDNGFLIKAIAPWEEDVEVYCPHERAVLAKVISLLGVEGELRVETQEVGDTRLPRALRSGRRGA